MSGNVVPSSGDINFNSNASLTAVRQVFGTGSNMLALINSPVDTVATRPPPFVAPFAPAAPLSLSYFRGKALFITPAPSDLRVTNFTTSTIRLQWSLNNVNSTSVRIAVGTSAGTINTLNWTTAVGGSDVNGTFSVNVPYYVSIYGSNGNGTASLAVSNANLFIIPAAPTFSSASISGETITTVASSVTSGADITYTINPSSGVNFVSPGVFDGLTVNTSYIVTAMATMSNAGAGYSSNSANSIPLMLPYPYGGNSSVISGSTKYLYFTSATGTLTIPTAFAGTITVLAVGGGGGGGGFQGGGGGAGVYMLVTYSGLSAGSYAVTIGQGGASVAGNTNVRASNGTSTVLGSILTAPGGGGGGSQNGAGGSGGSGGGGGGNNATGSGAGAVGTLGSQVGGTTISNLANAAGRGGGNTSLPGGGGGGAGGAGGQGTGVTDSPGGAGVAYVGITYARGGNGNRLNGSKGADASPNTGNGGQGGGPGTGLLNPAGGIGGSGILIVSFAYP